MENLLGFIEKISLHNCYLKIIQFFARNYSKQRMKMNKYLDAWCYTGTELNTERTWTIIENSLISINKTKTKMGMQLSSDTLASMLAATPH